MVADSLSVFDNNPFDKTVFIDGFISIGVSFVILLVSGLFVSFFIGDRIILSGLKKEKKMEEKNQRGVGRRNECGKQNGRKNGENRRKYRKK